MIRRTRFWDVATCTRVRHAMDRGAPSSAEIIVDGYVLDTQARRASDIEVDERTFQFAEREMARLQRWLSRCFDVHLSGFEGPAFLRYEVGGMYGPHRDYGGAGEPRAISVSLFLNGAGDADGFGGGVLRLYNDASTVDVVAEAGLLVAFPSDTVHEVLPVTAGVRDALVTWFLAVDVPAREPLG